MKKKNVFTIIIALVMTVMLGTVSVMADTPLTTDGRFLQGNAITNVGTYASGATTYLNNTVTTSTSGTYKVIVEAGDWFDNEYWEPDPLTAFYDTYDVTMSGYNDGITVYDILDAINTNETSDVFNIISTSRGNYLLGYDHNGTQWAAYTEDEFDYSLIALGGWQFRIDDRFPVQALSITEGNVTYNGYEGTGIDDSYVPNGAVLHLFFEYPGQMSPGDVNLAAYYVKGEYDTVAGGVQLKGQRLFMDQTVTIHGYPLHVLEYENLTNTLMGSNDLKYYCDLDVTDIEVTFTTLNGATTYPSTGAFSPNANGLVDVTNVPSGTYIMKTLPILNDMNGSSWQSYVEDVFFNVTSAYCEVTIP